MPSHRPKDPDTLSRIRSASHILQGLTSFGLVLVTGVSAGLILNPIWFNAAISSAFPELFVATGITPVKWLGLIGVMAIPLAITLYGLWHLRLLFAAYRGGRIFGDEAPAHLLKVGLAMAVNAGAVVVVHTLAVLILTFDNPPGGRQFAVSLSSNSYTLILTGGLLIVIGWVMREAARISDENRQFV